MDLDSDYECPPAVSSRRARDAIRNATHQGLPLVASASGMAGLPVACLPGGSTEPSRSEGPSDRELRSSNDGSGHARDKIARLMVQGDPLKGGQSWAWRQLIAVGDNICCRGCHGDIKDTNYTRVKDHLLQCGKWLASEYGAALGKVDKSVALARSTAHVPGTSMTISNKRFRQTGLDMATGGSMTVVPGHLAQQLQALYAEAIYLSGTPPAAMCHPAWQRFFNALNPAFAQPSRWVRMPAVCVRPIFASILCCARPPRCAQVPARQRAAFSAVQHHGAESTA